MNKKNQICILKDLMKTISNNNSSINKNIKIISNNIIIHREQLIHFKIKIKMNRRKKIKRMACKKIILQLKVKSLQMKLLISTIKFNSKIALT